MASTITADNGVSSGSAGLKSSADSSGVLALASGAGTTAVTIDASQNVGIGTSSPAGKLQVVGSAIFQNSGGGGTYGTNTTYYSGGGDISMAIGTSGSGFAYQSVTSNHSLVFGTNNAERMRIDSSGNVGVGVTPSAISAGVKAIQIGTGSADGFFYGLGGNDTEITTNAYFNSGYKYQTTGIAATRYFQSGGVHAWAYAASGTAGNAITFTEAMRIDSSGNLLVGTTSTATNFSTKFTLSTDSGTTKWAVGPSLASATQFVVSASNSAGVYLATTSATSWSAISDERHKDIIAPITNAVKKVSTLRCVIGKYKDDETNTQKPFLIAQDVLAVQPEAVDTSNPERFGLAYADLIPLLTAAIQEQQAIIEQLRADVETLKAKA